MIRERLPSRRQNSTLEFEFAGKLYTLCVGYDREGKPKEVFADGSKQGSAMEAFIDDACVMISLALQQGAEPEELLKSLTKLPAFHGGQEVEQWGSPIGVILSLLEERPELKEISV